MKIFLILILSLGITAAFAQKDKLYLKNGSVIRGTVAPASVTNDSVVVVNVSGEEIALPVSIIEEIRFKRRSYGKPDAYKNLTYPQGFYKTVRAGVILGGHYYTEALNTSLLLEAVYEYHYHPLLNVGIGAGFNGYGRYYAVPVYLQYQAMLGKRQNTFFVYGQFGYGFLKTKSENDIIIDTSNGMVSGLGIGFQKSVGKNLLQYKIGYQGQKLVEKTFPDNWIWGWPVPEGEHITRKRTMNRLVFSVSFSF